jgi:hypothetical protein
MSALLSSSIDGEIDMLPVGQSGGSIDVLDRASLPWSGEKSSSNPSIIGLIANGYGCIVPIEYWDVYSFKFIIVVHIKYCWPITYVCYLRLP